MRVISSFAVLARRSRRDFRVCWTPGQGWSDEHLTDLFDNTFNWIDEAEFLKLQESGLALDRAVQIIGTAEQRVWNWQEGAHFGQAFETARIPIVTYSGVQRCDAIMSPAERSHLLPRFGTQYAETVRKWTPVPSIRRSVDVLTEHFDPGVTGVHVRRGDSWREPRIAFLFQRSTDQAFFARIDRELSSGRSRRFFLATDCIETEHRFRCRYGSSVATNPHKKFVESVPGKPKGNQRDAAIDMFALARTNKILGNNYSSFSKLAAVLGGITWEAVLEAAD